MPSGATIQPPEATSYRQFRAHVFPAAAAQVQEVQQVQEEQAGDPQAPGGPGAGPLGR